MDLFCLAFVLFFSVSPILMKSRATLWRSSRKEKNYEKESSRAGSSLMFSRESFKVDFDVNLSSNILLVGCFLESPLR